MAKVNLGRVGFVLQGEYDPSKPYLRLDCVTKDGSTYAAKEDVPAGTDVRNETYWQTLVDAQAASKVRIDFDRSTNTFKVGDKTLNYKDLYDIHMAEPNFSFVVYGDRAYLLSYVQDDSTAMRQMRFQSVIVTTDSATNLSYTKTSGIYVRSSDGINIAGVDVDDTNSENSSYRAQAINDSNKTSGVWYTSAKAVVDYIESLNHEVNTNKIQTIDTENEDNETSYPSTKAVIDYIDSSGHQVESNKISEITNGNKTSTTLYPSNNAVTSYVDSINTSVGQRIGKIEAALQGNKYIMEVDDSQAYAKDVPDGAMQKAIVDMIGGKSVVLNQMSAHDRLAIGQSTTKDGITWTRIAQAIYEADGTATPTDPNAVGTYIYSDNTGASSWTWEKDHTYLLTGCPSVGIEDEFRLGLTANGVTQYPAITSLQGGSIIKQTSDTNLGKTMGISMFIYRDKTVNIAFKPCLVDLTKIFGADKAITLTIDSPEIKLIETCLAAYPEKSDGRIINADVISLDTDGMSYSIPETVRNQYPLHSVGSVYDSYEYDEDRWYYHQKVGAIDLGDLEWGRYGSGGTQYYRATLPINAVNVSGNRIGNIICSAYLPRPAATNATGYGDGIAINDSTYVRIIDSTKKDIDPSVFKELVTGIQFYYELANPRQGVDITNLMVGLPNGSISVTAGGTVTFMQAKSNRLPVPNSVTYMVKLWGDDNG